jgi:hypothetical protein
MGPGKVEKKLCKEKIMQMILNKKKIVINIELKFSYEKNLYKAIVCLEIKTSVF